MSNTTNTSPTKTTDNIRKITIKLRSVEEANRWLSEQDSITITSISFSTGTRPAFPVNNIVVTEVLIECLLYPYKINNRYGISENSFIRLYTSAKTDKLKSKWIEENPNKHYVCGMQRSARRHLVGTHFGFLSFVRDKFVVFFKY